MIKFWAESERFISSVKNRQEVIIIDENFLNLADESISVLKSRLQFLQSMRLWCMEWFVDIEFNKTSITAKELYDIEKIDGKQILTLKSSKTLTKNNWMW